MTRGRLRRARATSASRWRCGWRRPTASSCACTTSRPSRSPSWWRPAPRPRGSVAELAGDVDVLCVMVRDDDQVRDVLGRGARRRARRRSAVVVHSTVAPATPAELAVSAAGTASGCSTRRSAAARWAPPTARWRSWSAAPTAAFAAAEPVLARDGLAGRARRPDRRRHADEAGPQPDALRRVHRRHRGAAAGRGGRASTWSTLGEVVRHTDAITGGPGAIMHRDTTAPLGAGRLLARRLRPRRGRWARRTWRSRSSWPTTLGVDVPLAQLALRATSRRDWDCDGQVRRPPGGAPPRPGEDGGGLRLRDVRRRRATSSATPPTTCSATSGSGPGLTDRDRRLLLIGLLAGTGAPRRARHPGARPRYANGELDDEALREIVIFLCHYAGWPDRRPAQLAGRGDDRQGRRVPADTSRPLPPARSSLMSARPAPDLAAAGYTETEYVVTRHRDVVTPGDDPAGLRDPGRACAGRSDPAPGSAAPCWPSGSTSAAARTRRPTGPTWTRRSCAAVTPGSASRRSTSASRAAAARWTPDWAARAQGQRPGALRRRCTTRATRSCSTSSGRRWPGLDLAADVRLAVGESQSAVRAHDVRQRRASGGAALRRVPDPQPRRSGGAARRAGPGARHERGAARGAGDDPRRPRRARCFVVVTEGDLFDRIGFLPARQPDTDTFRLWEVAGTAHADGLHHRRVRGVPRLRGPGQPRPAGLRAPRRAAPPRRLGARRDAAPTAAPSRGRRPMPSSTTTTATSAAASAPRASTRRSRCCPAGPGPGRRSRAGCSAARPPCRPSG